MVGKYMLLLILSIFLCSVFGCEPLLAVPFWKSPNNGFWEIIGTTRTNPGLILNDIDYDSVIHVLLSGVSDWGSSNSTMIYKPLVYNETIYVTSLVKSFVPVVNRINAVDGKFLSNISINVEDVEEEGFLTPVSGCNGVLYFLYGDVFQILVSSYEDGVWIWQTDEGVISSTVVISNNCNFVTFVLDPLDNSLNFCLVRLNAKTGSIIWKIDLGLNRQIGLYWDWSITESDVSNRIAIAYYRPNGAGHDMYYFKLIVADSGKKTLEIYYPGGKPTFISSIVFSRDGSLVVFSPFETFCYKIAGNEDVQLWSTVRAAGVAANAYFSKSGKSVLFNIWDLGEYQYIAQNTNDGSMLWESTWNTITGLDFFEYGADVLLETGRELYKLDLITCPLP